MLTNFYSIWHTLYRLKLQYNNYWFIHFTYVLLLHYLWKVNLLLFWLSSPCACSVKLRNSFLRTYGLPVTLVLIQLTIESGAWCRIACIRHQFRNWPIWDNAWLTLGMTYRKALWMMLLMNGTKDFRPVWMKKDIFNTCCNILGLVQTGCLDKVDVLLVCTTKSVTCLVKLYFCNRLLLQRSAAAVRRWGGQINNCYVAK